MKSIDVLIITLVIVVAFGFVAAGRWWGAKANAVLTAPCAATTVDGVRCVYCTTDKGVALSCDWSRP